MRQDGRVSSDPTPAAAPDNALEDEAPDNAVTDIVMEDDAVTDDDAAAVSGPGHDDTVPSPVSSDPAGPADEADTLTVVLLDPTALEVARAAAVAEAGDADHVGAFTVAVAEDDIAVTANFAANQPGYHGWRWSVTLAVLTPDHPTVSEVVLLPGEGALLAPAWIPWDQRIRPGDVGVGDLLPPIVGDPRLVPAYVQSDDPAVEAVARELGIGRVRVLSREGRDDFAERLHDGPFGPADQTAIAAPAHCVTCGFYLPLAGSLGQLTGACGNEFSPADGRVVDAGYGCGAHSETVMNMPARSAATDILIDELTLEVHPRPWPVPLAEVPDQERPDRERSDREQPDQEQPAQEHQDRTHQDREHQDREQPETAAGAQDLEI